MDRELEQFYTYVWVTNCWVSLSMTHVEKACAIYSGMPLLHFCIDGAMHTQCSKAHFNELEEIKPTLNGQNAQLLLFYNYIFMQIYDNLRHKRAYVICIINSMAVSAIWH